MAGRVRAAERLAAILVLAAVASGGEAVFSLPPASPASADKLRPLVTKGLFVAEFEAYAP